MIVYETQREAMYVANRARGREDTVHLTRTTLDGAPGWMVYVNNAPLADEVAEKYRDEWAKKS